MPTTIPANHMAIIINDLKLQDAVCSAAIERISANRFKLSVAVNELSVEFDADDLNDTANPKLPIDPTENYGAFELPAIGDKVAIVNGAAFKFRGQVSFGVSENAVLFSFSSTPVRTTGVKVRNGS